MENTTVSKSAQTDLELRPHVPKKYHYTKKTGRPTSYKPKYCQEIIKYFNVPHFKQIGKKQVANPLPFIKMFAVKIGVAHDTLCEWVKVHREFSESFTIAKHLQEQMLISNALKGLYDSRFAIFAAKNMIGWVDRTEIDHGLADELLNKFKDQKNDALISESARLAREVLSIGGDSNSTAQAEIPKSA